MIRAAVALIALVPIRRLASVARLLALFVLACACANVSAQDPNFEHPHRVVVAKRDGYTISALVTHAKGAGSFKYGIALFPGHPGVMQLREENGEPKFGLQGNMLVRSRRWWLDNETLVAVIDAPSDQPAFPQLFRQTERYGADVAAILNEVAKQFPVQDWTLVGTSEGSISAFHAARMNPALAKRVILTASVFKAGRNGPGLSSVKYTDLASQLLFVHHESDPCEYTRYAYAREDAERSKAPLITVKGGGPSRGGDCQAYTAHGFVGVERETVVAMREWVKTGKAVAEVKP
jgi:hypothetical protein